MSRARVVGIRAAVPASLFLALSLSPALAQEAPRVRVGAGVGIDLLVGDASDFLDGGTSRFLGAAFRLDRADRFHLRVEGTSTPLDDDEEPTLGTTAENRLYTLTVGPQATGRIGALRPYAALVAGLAGGTWRMEVDEDFDTAVPDEDSGSESALGWGGHAGVGFAAAEGSRPVVLFLEARVFDVGALVFARSPDPSDTRSPFGLTEADAAVLSVRAGVTLGF